MPNEIDVRDRAAQLIQSELLQDQSGKTIWEAYYYTTLCDNQDQPTKSLESNLQSSDCVTNPNLFESQDSVLHDDDNSTEGVVSPAKPGGTRRSNTKPVTRPNIKSSATHPGRVLRSKSISRTKTEKVSHSNASIRASTNVRPPMKDELDHTWLAKHRVLSQAFSSVVAVYGAEYLFRICFTELYYLSSPILPEPGGRSIVPFTTTYMVRTNGARPSAPSLPVNTNSDWIKNLINNVDQKYGKGSRQENGQAKNLAQRNRAVTSGVQEISSTAPQSPPGSSIVADSIDRATTPITVSSEANGQLAAAETLAMLRTFSREMQNVINGD